MTRPKNGNGKKLLISTLAAAMTIIMLIGGLIWKASAQSERLRMVRCDVAAVEPKVEINKTQIIDNRERIRVLETKQQAILDGVKRIEQKIDDIP